ncbi:hypothetical protein MCOR25_003474 [Pyricularia grisea]|uniref:DUF7702 domain-containing protein n=1 Tax=Pyricularia grisea TaxID=148305 RepID=A0A6P8BJL9_PYRGI|nr:uncharacterized protein PgNI_00818 [Pyricularia grisea]KAI6373268.1 hypothetical protein MCOR25_003474 [Pyricularia grisea]TLD16879.1 hypothetical protein PgNI_00818 [Pyricularia grisea]
MTELTELNRISIVEIVVYTPALAIGILLASRHGFKKASGWLYLILFSLIRIIGGALDLASIQQPGNTGLVSATNSLRSAGLSPLILVSVGLLTRVLLGLEKKTNTILQPRMLQLIQLAVMIGLILSIVGGIKFGNKLSDATSKKPVDVDALRSLSNSTESRIGTALMILGYVALVLATGMLSMQIKSVERGERRLIGAVAATLPFILIRIIYAAVATYNTWDPNFHWYVAGPHYYDYMIGMCVVMEMITVAILEAVGLTLQKLPGDGTKYERATGYPMTDSNDHQQKPSTTPEWVNNGLNA